MDISLFHSFLLSQVLGLYLIIMAVMVMARMTHIRDIVNRLDPNSFSVFASSSSMLLFGIFAVTIHNYWNWHPSLLVTIVCWIILVRSILWIAFPERMTKMAKVVINSSGSYLMALLILIVGTLLLARGTHLVAIVTPIMSS